MSALLSKLNIAGMVVVDPATALSLIAFRGEWSALAAAIVSKLDNDNAPAGSLVKLDSIGLAPADFARTKATDTKPVGTIDYSGLSSALRVHGMKLVPVVGDDNARGVLVPSNRDAIKAAVAASKAKAAAKAKAKAAAKKRGNRR